MNPSDLSHDNEPASPVDRGGEGRPDSDRTIGAELAAARERYRELFDNGALGYLVLDGGGLIRRASASARALLRRERRALEGRRLQTLCTTETAGRVDAHLQRLIAGASRDSCEVRILGHGGPPIDVRIETCHVEDSVDGPLRAALIDLTEQRLLEARLAIVASVIEHASEGIMILDAERRVVAVNPAFTAITGYPADEVIGKPPRILLDQPNDSEQFRRIREQLAMTGRWQGEIWNRRNDGERYLEWLNLTAISDESGALTNYVGLFTDISSQRRIKQELYDLAYLDGLTGLANRAHLLAELGNALFTAVREGDLVALLYLDLDRFKGINDGLGHSAGDQLLRFVAHLLRDCVRKSDIVARLGADEFGVVLPQLAGADDAAKVANKILRAFQAIPFLHEGIEYQISASIGIALFPDDAQDPEELLRCADIAAYRTQASGRNGYSFFASGMSADLRERHRLEADLRRAVARGDLSLQYQPQVRLVDGRIVGCEALVRWNQEVGDPVPPERFIPIAEESGLIVPLGEWVLNETLKQISDWRPHIDDTFRVSINVSGSQLGPMHAARLFNRLLEAPAADRRLLELELTESALMAQPEPMGEVLSRLKFLGLGIAVDDFGTSYSSVNALKRLPIGRIKIDISLIKNLGAEPVDGAIASAIVTMAHSLGMKTVAEGVETPAQLAFLLDQGCDEAQGYLFSPPLDAPAMRECLVRGASLLPAAAGRPVPMSIGRRIRRILDGLPRRHPGPAEPEAKDQE